jgi:hypothetical protein
MLVCTYSFTFDQDLGTDDCTARSVDGSSAGKHESSTRIDGVNLSLARGQVTEVTFVETREVDEKVE